MPSRPRHMCVSESSFGTIFSLLLNSGKERASKGELLFRTAETGIEAVNHSVHFKIAAAGNDDVLCSVIFLYMIKHVVSFE